MMLWFLILVNYSGGILSLPQPSLEACQNTAQFVNNKTPYPQRVFATCVQGLK